MKPLKVRQMLDVPPAEPASTLVWALPQTVEWHGRGSKMLTYWMPEAAASNRQEIPAQPRRAVPQHKESVSYRPLAMRNSCLF